MRTVVATFLAGIAALAPLGAWAQTRGFSPVAVPDALGVNIHFTNPRAGEMEMLAGAGFKWIRMDFHWGGTEREKGKYDFSKFEQLLESLAPLKIRALFILDYGNRLYDGGQSPHTDQGRAAMARWAAAAVKHFAGRGIVWEMWNEPNISFWKPKPNVENYAKLAVAVGKAIREAAPGEIYVGPGTSQIDLAFLEECFKQRCLDYWDGVTVHPYRQQDPETSCEEYRKLRLLIARYAPSAKTIPVLSGEWGYSAAWRNFDEDRQGKYLPRELLVNLYNQIPLSIWYDWHDDGADPKEPEHHFGTVKFPYRKDQSPVYEPKPAYLAMQTLSKSLAGLACNKRLWAGDDQDWVLLFGSGDHVKFAAWTTSKSPRKLTIPASPGAFTVTDYLGQKRQALQAGANGLQIEVDDTVQYLAPEKPNDLLKIAAAWQRAPLELVVTAPAKAAAAQSITNPLARPIRIGGIEIPPGATRELPATAQGASAHLHRNSPPAQVILELPVESLGVLRQATVATVSNPISVTAMPVPGAGLAVAIDNPTGQPFAGELALRSLSGAKAGEDRIAVDMRVCKTRFDGLFNLAEIHSSFAAGIQVTDRAAGGTGGDFSLPPARYTAVDIVSAGSGNGLKTYPDGDNAIKSEHALTAGEAPAPLPTGQQPAALRLTYAYEQGWKFVRVFPSPGGENLRPIPGKPRQAGMWVYGDGTANLLTLRFLDASGQTFQPRGVKLDFTGWRWVTMPLDGADTGYWGKGDGTIKYPIRWDTFFLVDGRRHKTSGDIWVTGLTLIE